MAKLAKKKTVQSTTKTTKKIPINKSVIVKKSILKKSIKKTANPIVKPVANTLSKNTTKKRILIVDDEADIRTTVKTLLEREGFLVDIAQNSDECIKKVSVESYNLILLDIMMPGTPVKMVVEKVTTIPIAFLSVVRTSEEEQRALLARPNVKAFIQKPFNIKDLVSIVKRLTA